MRTTRILEVRKPPTLGVFGALVVTALAAHAGGDVTGTWMSEPTLGQLGFIQSTYVFKNNRKFSMKMDFQSFCGMGAVTPDCEYFWMVFDGDYSISGNLLSVKIAKGQHIQKRKGEPKPIVRDDTPQRGNISTYDFSIDGSQLTLTERRKGKQQVFVRQP